MKCYLCEKNINKVYKVNGKEYCSYCSFLMNELLRAKDIIKLNHIIEILDIEDHSKKVEFVSNLIDKLFPTCRTCARYRGRYCDAELTTYTSPDFAVGERMVTWCLLVGSNETCENYVKKP